VQCAIPIVMSKAKRKMQECARAWESEVKAWESERERGRAKSNNAILSVRDKVRSLETRSESQQGSETRGGVLLVFLVCTGEYIYNVKF
jgi:hypothetical protein